MEPFRDLGLQVCIPWGRLGRPFLWRVPLHPDDVRGAVLQVDGIDAEALLAYGPKGIPAAGVVLLAL